MSIRLVVFDLDGTLVASLEGIAYSMNQVLQRHGYPQHNLEKFRLFVGDGLKKVVERSIPDQDRSKEEIQRLYQELRHVYDHGYSYQLRLFPGIPETLGYLQKKGIFLAVNTNKNQGVSEKIANDLLHPWPIKMVVGSRESVPKKPSPVGLRSIMDQLQVRANETLYVGDTSIDLETAKNAGVRCISVVYGFRTKEELLPYNPQFLIEHPTELIRLLESKVFDVD